MSESDDCEPGEYESVDEVLSAVKNFVEKHKEDSDYFTGFKIQVFLGRGVHKFTLNDKLTEAQKNVVELQYSLDAAKHKLEIETKKKKQKRSE